MRDIKRFVAILLIMVATLLLSSCGPKYKNIMMDQAREKGWNEAKQNLAYRYSLRLYMMEKEKGTDGEYNILLSRLSKTQVRERFEKFLKDFDDLLDYKNEENTKYIEFFGLRPELEHDEKIYQALYGRLRIAELADTFADLTGTSSSYGKDSWRVKGYNPKQIFKNDYSDCFRSELIETAKREGTLKQIEHVVWFDDHNLGLKQPNPNHPNDSNDFIWLPQKRGLELINYKILRNERPETNAGNYIEGVRIELGVDPKTKTVSIRRESLPALRIFMEGAGGKGVMILDKDLENQDIGFGIPDIVETITVTSANELLSGSSGIIQKLFEVKQAHTRIAPKVPPIQLQVAAADAETNFWELAPDSNGWKVPVEYKNKQADNFRVKLKTEREKLPDGSVSNNVTIKYLEKEWTHSTDKYQPSRGAVVERFKMKPPFDGKVVSAKVMSYDNEKKVSIVLLNGQESQGLIVRGDNVFIKEKSYMVFYTEGQKRFVLVDEDGDGKFEKRKEVGVSKNEDMETDSSQ